MWGKKRIRPQVVAAITAVLLADGRIGAGDRIVAVQPVRQDSLWRQVGLTELMFSRQAGRRFGLK